MTIDLKTPCSLPSWDLTDLYSSVGDPKIKEDFDKALEKSERFKIKYQNKIETLSANTLSLAIAELEKINEIYFKGIIFAHLLHAADSSKKENGALFSELNHQATKIKENLTFFDLEISNLSQTKINKLLESFELKKYKHFVETTRKFKPYQLSEKEEILVQKLSLTGSEAWSRLFDETLARTRFKLKIKGEEKELSEEETLSLAYSPDRQVRKSAALALTRGLKENAHLLNYIFSTLTQDFFIEDSFRKYEHPKKRRNLSNEISDQSVENLLSVTLEQKNLVPRFYKLKTKILKLKKLYDYDRYAPLGLLEEKKWTWTEAKNFVLEAYQEFDPEFGSIVKEFFEKNWIDAQLRPGKIGGAFSASATSDTHPYILVNFTGTTRDVSTLAHELGHGIHQYLSRKVGFLQSDTPLTTAETASVFGEMLIFDRMLRKSQSKQEKLGLIVTKIDEIIATVFRQVCMTKFEEKLHAQRREIGELNLEEINKIWLEENQKIYQDSVELTENYGYWWLYIPHFIHSPFYCYAYAFGLLLSITLYEKSKSSGIEFKEQYKEILSAGGSIEPIELIKKAKIDISEADFWKQSFALIENLLEQAEEISKQI